MLFCAAKLDCCRPQTTLRPIRVQLAADNRPVMSVTAGARVSHSGHFNSLLFLGSFDEFKMNKVFFLVSELKKAYSFSIILYYRDIC